MEPSQRHADPCVLAAARRNWEELDQEGSSELTCRQQGSFHLLACQASHRLKTT